MARAEADSLVTRLSASERRAARMETELRSTQVAHRAQLARALEIDVLFRTEESAVDEITEQRLAQLAELVAPIEGTLIHVEGHADVRGTEKYNAELSAARAAAVRDALLRGGLTPDRIIVTAVGKSRATASEQDVEGLARDRRVAVSIVTLEDLQRVALQD